MALREDSTLGWSLVTITSTANLFGVFNPDLSQVRRTVDGDPRLIAELRAGYRPALMLSLGVAGALSLLTQSALPILAAATTAGAMIQTYEGSLPVSARVGIVEAIMQGRNAHEATERDRQQPATLPYSGNSGDAPIVFEPRALPPLAVGLGTAITYADGSGRGVF